MIRKHGIVFRHRNLYIAQALSNNNVNITEITIEPKQPRRLEKKKNMRHLIRSTTMGRRRSVREDLCVPSSGWR